MRESTIVFIVPYFGKFPVYFDFWLKSCEYNPSVDWMIFTDDETDYPYPKNVLVHRMSFEQFKTIVQSSFDFEIALSAPYKLCDYKPAYGMILHEFIKDYDFWGYCDVDLIFGNIRKFFSEDILRKYSMVGFQGHSTLFRNNDEVNTRFKLPLNGKLIYESIFTSSENCFFDENGLIEIYNERSIPFYDGIVFANINPMYYNFQLTHMDTSGKAMNQHLVFSWELGKITAHSAIDGGVVNREFMYVHFLKRPISVSLKCSRDIQRYLIVPNEIKELNGNIEYKDIINYSQNKMWKYWLRIIRTKWRKISPKRVFVFFKTRIIAKINKI